MDKYTIFLKAHERLILVLALLAFGVFTVQKVREVIYNHDQTQAQIAHDNAITASQALTDAKAEFAKQLADLQSQIAQRDKQNVVQKQADDKMSAPELAARIASLVQIHPQDVTQSQLPNHLDLDPTAAHAVTNALEDGATCKVDLAQTQSLLQQSQALTATTQTAFDLEKVSHTADVKTLKAKNKTEFFRGVKVGSIVTAVALIGIKIAAHF